jgi:hypothetical protein
VEGVETTILVAVAGITDGKVAEEMTAVICLSEICSSMSPRSRTTTIASAATKAMIRRVAMETVTTRGSSIKLVTRDGATNRISLLNRHTNPKESSRPMMFGRKMTAKFWSFWRRSTETISGCRFKQISLTGLDVCFLPS